VLAEIADQVEIHGDAEFEEFTPDDLTQRDRPWTTTVEALISLWLTAQRDRDEAIKLIAETERNIAGIMAQNEAEERVFGDWLVSRREKTSRRLLSKLGQDKLYEGVRALQKLGISPYSIDKLMTRDVSIPEQVLVNLGVEQTLIDQAIEIKQAQLKFHGPYMEGYKAIHRMGGQVAIDLEDLIEVVEDKSRPLMIERTDEAKLREREEAKLDAAETEAQNGQ
jgi:hypothetical protein